MTVSDWNYPKFALVSHVLPPSPSGQAVVLYRLLRDLDPTRYCLIGPQESMPQISVTQSLRGPYHGVPDPIDFRVTPILRTIRENTAWAAATMRLVQKQWLHRAGNAVESADFTDPPPISEIVVPGSGWKGQCKSLLHWVEDRCNVPRQIAYRAQQILHVLAKENCRAVVACSGDLVDLPAAFHAARRANLPFFAYMFDDYQTNSLRSYHQEFVRRVTPVMVRGAAGVAVPNRFLAEAYRQRYGIEPWIIPNPIEDTERPAQDRAMLGRPARIVYTGAVYEAHYDAFQRLLGTLLAMQDSAPELHIYTPMSKKLLARNQIGSPAVIHEAVPTAEANRLQRAADIVFLPLAFDSAYPELIHTSAPGKMGELLASGRPILVHAPKDSFVSWYFRKYECGAVVDEKDPALLQQAIRRLLDSPDYRRDLAQRARARAESDFSLAYARGQFLAMLAHPSTLRRCCA